MMASQRLSVPPGFPFFLVLLYGVVGVSYPAAYISFAVWGGVGCVATYFLARQLVSKRLSRWATLFAVFYPADLFGCSFFFSEVVFSPCLGIGVALFVHSIRKPTLWLLFIAGLFLGYATLTRPFGVLFLPLLVAYLFFSTPSRWLASLVFSVGFLAVILPWTVRNYLVFGKLVLIATNGGSTFYSANNDLVASKPRDYGNWVATTRLPGRDLIDAQPDEVSHDKKEWELGIDWVKSHPGKFIFLGGCKAIRFWLPFVNYPSFKVYPVINILSMTPFIILILLGIIRTLKSRTDRHAFAVLHLILLANLIMVVIFWGDPRFRDANVLPRQITSSLSCPSRCILNLRV